MSSQAFSREIRPSRNSKRCNSRKRTGRPYPSRSYGLPWAYPLNDRFVDGERIAVEATHRDDPRVLEVVQELAVEDADRTLAADGVRFPAHGVVLDVIGVSREDRADVTLLLRREVPLEDPIDLVACHRLNSQGPGVALDARPARY